MRQLPIVLLLLFLVVPFALSQQVEKLALVPPVGLKAHGKVSASEIALSAPDVKLSSADAGEGLLIGTVIGTSAQDPYSPEFVAGSAAVAGMRAGASRAADMPVGSMLASTAAEVAASRAASSMRAAIRAAAGSVKAAAQAGEAVGAAASTISGSAAAYAGVTVEPLNAGFYRNVFGHNTVVGYYGNPNTRYMGILGEDSVEQAAQQLEKLCGEYNAVNGPKGVVPAFEIVYGTVYANADIGYVSTAKVMQYIRYAQSHGMLVILDHQLGKYSVEEAIRKMLPFLMYPCVNLAIDPEWKTLQPGKVIGTISGKDINAAEQLMQDYMRQHGIPGKKILIVHQFNYRMITDRQLVRADFSDISLVLNADGFGPPNLKHMSWDYNVEATNIPLKGFKLFFAKPWEHTGYDDPIMTPADVMKMNPQPAYVSYQ